jgi:NADPH:quinone reductase-like Zn-dependent oxidoreductase
VKLIVERTFGPPKDVLQLKEIDMPVVEEDEVLVRVHAASIHFGDYGTIASLPYERRCRLGWNSVRRAAARHTIA